MGVLTHLDGFRDSKRLKKTKKTLKHRFWAEIYQGALSCSGLPIGLTTSDVLLFRRCQIAALASEQACCHRSRACVPSHIFTANA